MLQLKNLTPLTAAFAKFPNAQGIDTVYVVATATFQLTPRVELSELQLPVVLSDEYFAEPVTSSLRYAGELHLGKPATDVIVVGHARAPEGRPVTELKVGLRIAEREKVLQVFGDRHWRGLQPSRPAPLVEMPIRYERAFGGAEERNPLGVGLSLAHGCPAVGDTLPNIEDPRQLLTVGVRPAPAGFGCIAPAWLPRRALVGTYDEAWQRTRAPFVPEDFQASYFNCASDGLVFNRHLSGGEPLLLVGMTERGPIRTSLPRCTLETTFVIRGERQSVPSRLQTVLIEPDHNRLRLSFHAHCACDKSALEVERIELSLSALDMPALA